MVDDNGWIISTTDENGVGYTTSYGYDAMGRLARIAYPTADSVAWNTTLQTFAPSAAAMYGVPAGLWKQTISTGNARKEIYFDALWRPLVADVYDNADAANTRSVSVTRYDAGGRAAYQSYPLRTLVDYATVTQGIRTTYDALDRVTQVDQDSELGVLSTKTQYLTGFRTQVTNPRGFVSTQMFQAFDAPSYDAPVQIDAAKGTTQAIRTLITRDAFGKPIQLTRGPGN